MKKLIRKWLGIEALETKVEALPFGKMEIRKLVGQALIDAMDGKEDESFGRAWYLAQEGVLNNFEAAVKRVASGHTEEISKDLISQKIDSEQFIDDIVARIKRKQLNA